MNRAVLGALLLVGVGLGAATPLHAQSRWSVDAVAGVANVSGGDYGKRQRSGGGARVDLRVATIGGTAFFVGGAVANYVGYHTQVVAPTVPCFDPVTQAPIACNYPPVYPGAPNFSYLSGQVGLQRAVGPAVTIELDAGTGPVHASGVTSGNRRAVSGDVNVILRLDAPVYLVVGAQMLSWTEEGTNLRAYPITVGLRVH